MKKNQNLGMQSVEVIEVEGKKHEHREPIENIIKKQMRLDIFRK